MGIYTGTVFLEDNLSLSIHILNVHTRGTSVKNQAANAGDIREVGSIPGLRRYPGRGHGNPL